MDKKKKSVFPQYLCNKENLPIAQAFFFTFASIHFVLLVFGFIFFVYISYIAIPCATYFIANLKVHFVFMSPEE